MISALNAVRPRPAFELPLQAAKTKPSFGNHAQLKATPPANPNIRVLGAYDIDQTLVPWEGGSYSYNAESVEKTARFRDTRPDYGVILPTGRGYTSFFNDVVPIAKKAHLAIDGAILNDGQQLLVRPASLTSEQWLDMLKPVFDEDWQRKIEFEDGTGWETRRSMAFTQQVFTEKGLHANPQHAETHGLEHQGQFTWCRPIFRRDPGITPEILAGTQGKAEWLMKFYPDQTYFQLMSLNTPDNIDMAPYARHLAKAIERKLKRHGIQAHSYLNVTRNPGETRQRVYIHIGPKDVSKASAINYYLEKHAPNVVAQIRAGDSPNDIPMLQDPSVYAIQVGEHPVVTQALADRTGKPLEKVHHAQLPEGLERQWGNILSDHPELAQPAKPRLALLA